MYVLIVSQSIHRTYICKEGEIRLNKQRGLLEIFKGQVCEQGNEQYAVWRFTATVRRDRTSWGCQAMVHQQQRENWTEGENQNPDCENGNKRAQRRVSPLAEGSRVASQPMIKCGGGARGAGQEGSLGSKHSGKGNLEGRAVQSANNVSNLRSIQQTVRNSDVGTLERNECQRLNLQHNPVRR